MGSALQSFVSQQSPPHFISAHSHCEISLGRITRGSHAHLFLRAALDRTLLSEPHPATSLLSEVRDSCLPVIARFEAGDESLEQRLATAARPPALLPLPFLWSVRVVTEAAAALDFHHRLGTSSAVELCTRGIITVRGKTRLNAAILEPRERLADVGEPHRLSLAATLAACLVGADPTRRLGLTRPLLPASVIQFIDGARARASHDSNWNREFELLRQQQRRLQGPHFSGAAATRYSPRELCSHQLSLLPALRKLEGEAAIDRFFAHHAESATAEVEQFHVAHESWRRERRLAVTPPLSGSATLERAKLDEEIASQVRIAQARFEFERRDPRRALLFAIDAVQATPDSPAAWLLLGEIRSSTCSASQALCLSEAICAARGESRVIELALRQLGLRNHRQLAAYFRVHGDHVLADWLDPPQRWFSAHQIH